MMSVAETKDARASEVSAKRCISDKKADGLANDEEKYTRGACVGVMSR